MTGCFSCKHAIQARKDFRRGDQVKCAMAEKMFGYKGWVDAKEESTCGVEEPFKGSPIEETKALPAPKPKYTKCLSCMGNGMVIIMIGSTSQSMKCRMCSGQGTVETKGES